MTDNPKNLTEAEWRERLTPEQYHVLREAGTERAFTGQYDKHYEEGTYTCAGCGTVLFESDAKYNSGCGWPAFTKPAENEKIEEKRDVSFGMIRTEVLCAECGGHLGHVFPDGPPEEGGMRYCINSLSLDFDEKRGRRDKRGIGGNTPFTTGYNSPMQFEPMQGGKRVTDER